MCNFAALGFILTINYKLKNLPREVINSKTLFLSNSLKESDQGTELRSTMDKSMLGDLDNLPEEDKVRMSTMIDQLQIRDRCDIISLFNCLVGI